MARNPNGKVPVLIDEELHAGDDALTESAAILVYLAERHEKLGEQIACEIAGAKKVVLPAAHQAAIETPTAFCNAWLDFIAKAQHE